MHNLPIHLLIDEINYLSFVYINSFVNHSYESTTESDGNALQTHIFNSSSYGNLDFVLIFSKQNWFFFFSNMFITIQLFYFILYIILFI